MPMKKLREITPVPYMPVKPSQQPPYTARTGGLTAYEVAALQRQAEVNTARNLYEQYKQEMEDRMRSGTKMRQGGGEQAYERWRTDAYARARAGTASANEVAALRAMMGREAADNIVVGDTLENNRTRYYANMDTAAAKKRMEEMTGNREAYEKSTKGNRKGEERNAMLGRMDSEISALQRDIDAAEKTKPMVLAAERKNKPTADLSNVDWDNISSSEIIDLIGRHTPDLSTVDVNGVKRRMDREKANNRRIAGLEELYNRAEAAQRYTGYETTKADFDKRMAADPELEGLIDAYVNAQPSDIDASGNYVEHQDVIYPSADWDPEPHIQDGTFDIAPQTTYSARMADARARAFEPLRAKGYTEEEILAYLDAKTRLENRENALRETAEARKRVEDGGFWTDAWETAKNVPRRLIGGPAGALRATFQKMNGDPVDWYDPFQVPGMKARATTEQIAGDIAEDSKFLSAAYQLGNSALDMVAVAASAKLGLAPAVGAAMMGGSAAQQAMFDAHERGVSDANAVSTGIAAGIFETFFERVSLESLLKTKAITATDFRGKFLQTMGNLGKQAFVEGSEEVFTTLANEAYDRLKNGGLSEYETNVRRYMEEGLSAADARKKATSDFVSGLASDFIGGAVMGGVMGGVGTGVNTLLANRQAKSDYSVDAAALVQEALEIDPVNQTALDAQKRLDQGKELSANTLRTLVEQNERKLSAAEQETDDTTPRGTQTDPAAEYAAEFGTAAEDFVTAMRPGQNLQSYYEGFKTAYVYGQANAGGSAQIDEAVRTELRDELDMTDDQIDLAYKLGRAEVSRHGGTDTRGAAHFEMTENEKGADYEQEGTRVRDGSQRTDGQSAGGQAGSVAEGTGDTEVRRAQSRPADRGAASFTYARDSRSSAQLIGSGRASSADSLRIVTGGKSASVQRAEQMARERGLVAHFYTDGDMTVMKDGKAVKCRGYIEGKAVFIRADDPSFTADQIMRHEIGHDMIDSGEVDVEAVRERLREKFTAEELERVAQIYADLYEGSGMTADEIWEEIICDSLGDMNVFSGTMTAKGAPVGLLLESAKQETLAQEKDARGPPNEQKNTAPNEDGKMSRAVEPRAEWKAEQLRIIQENNAMDDDYHTGIRSVEDIKTFREALADQDWDGDEFAPDYTRSMAEHALHEGKIRVYSSKEITEGAFVTPSRMEAESYAGGNTVNVKRVRLEDVAWISPIEGMYTGSAARSAANRTTAGRTYSYAELTAKAPITGVVVTQSDMAGLFNKDGSVNTGWLVKHVWSQCQTVRTNATTPVHYVSVADLGRNVEVTSDSITHGVKRDNATAPNSKENAIGTVNLAESLGNAIEVNQAGERGNADVPYSHVLIGVTGVENSRGKIDYMAVRYVVEERENQDPILVESRVLSRLYAVNAKKMGSANVQVAYRTLASASPHFSYNIADLLNDVKDVFRDTFSKDVYAHFGMTRKDTDFSEGEITTLPNGTVGRPGNLKFSQASDELEALRQENAELQERVKSFEKELRQTEKKLADARESRDKWRNKATFSPERVGREIIKAYDGTVKEAEIHDAVKAMIDHAARRDGISFEQMKELAMPAAQKIVQSAEAAVNSEEAHTWDDIKKYHKGTELKLTQEVLNDFRDEPDFKYDFRKNYAVPLHLNNQGRGVDIDVAYAEMGERFGYDLYPDSITHPADQLRRMAEVLGNLKPVMENPYSLNMAMATEHCANELVDKVMGEVARGYKATYAGQLEERLYQTRKAARDMVLRERQRSDEAMRELKKHWKDQQRAQGEKRMENEERDRLLKIARRLQNKKLPEAQRSLLNQYIGDLDTVSRSLTGRTLGDLNWLEHWYNEQKADPDFIPDAATEARIHRLYEKHVDDLSREDVLDLTYTLLNIENEMRTKNQLIESKETRDVFEAGLQLIRDMEEAPGSKASGVRSAIDKLIVTQTLSPVRQARRVTGYVENDPLTIAVNELADGQRKAQDYEMRALKRFDAFLEDKQFVRDLVGKHAKEISIQGIGKDGPVEVQITPAMRISLYLHSLSPENLRHIAGGGITVPDMKLYKQGKMQEAYARGTTVKLTPSQVRSITAHMSAQEMRFAQVAREYFNTVSKESINDVSEKLKGYSIAQVDNYFPINTDTSFTKKEFESIKFDGTIEGMGFLKERIKSSSPIMLRDLNSVLTQAIGLHAKYVGLAVPVRNFNKLWGVTAHNVTEDGDMGASSSVQETMGKQWGEESRKYFEKLMRDLQNGSGEKNAIDRVFDRVRSNYAGAVLTLNMSVAMKQAASYPTAAAVVGWSPLAKAFKSVGKVDLDLIAAYTPLQWYRSRGFSTQELGDMAKRGKQLPAALNWVQGADLLTTRKLWKAAEIYVEDNFGNLKRGTTEEIRAGKSAFYKKVAEVYNRIIEETQPNYTTMQRPQLLRTDSTWLQSVQMFKTQPFQNFNILYDAIGELQARERAWKNTQSAESLEALRSAKQNAWRAVTSQAVQLLVFSLMTAAWNAFRRKKDKYADKNGDVSFGSIAKGVGLDMVGGLFAEVPFGGDVWEAGSAAFGGGRYNGIDDVTASAVTDAAKALINGGKTVSGLLTGEITDFNTFRLKMDSVADAISKTAGIPYENVLNIFKATYRNGAHLFKGDYLGEYDYLCLTTSPDKTADYYDLLWEAYRNDPAAHKAVYRKMVADGWDPDKIKTAMETRMKNAEGVSSVKDLKNRYTAP